MLEFRVGMGDTLLEDVEDVNRQKAKSALCERRGVVGGIGLQKSAVALRLQPMYCFQHHPKREFHGHIGNLSPGVTMVTSVNFACCN